ncbi:hypothetical protein PR048_003556 [Dryococelus australis]|uniref:Reverse transcriptase domain-containing protein n=1 Tax=Dryococelus australis TaxID=614101 RepID=A0ABQ9INH0_9NEOP|nr:hypothetical protein PR048_003556 [Dryococelus australis]
MLPLDKTVTSSELITTNSKAFRKETATSDINGNLANIVSAITDSIQLASVTKSNRKYKNKYSLTPWATGDFMKLVKERDLLFKKFKMKRSNVSIKSQLSQLNNRITSLKRNLRANYYNKIFANCSGNGKLVWQNINCILGRTLTSCTTIESLSTQDNKVIHDQHEITNVFRQHFVTVGTNLSKSFPDTPENINKLQTLDRYSSSIFMAPVDESEIDLIINKLQEKSQGPDNIPVKIVKSCKTYLIPMLAYVINQSLTDGVYPHMLKIASIIPVFKSGNNKSVNNYRPISALSVSVIFITNCRFGFRKNRNTEAAATKLVDSIRKTTDKNKVAGAIFVDLCKAFDTLFRSYLTNCYQYVQIIKHKSLPQLISVGVLQGSVLRPRLFLIYINDIGSLRFNGPPTLFCR